MVQACRRCRRRCRPSGLLVIHSGVQVSKISTAITGWSAAGKVVQRCSLLTCASAGRASGQCPEGPCTQWGARRRARLSSHAAWPPLLPGQRCTIWPASASFISISTIRLIRRQLREHRGPHSRRLKPQSLRGNRSHGRSPGAGGVGFRWSGQEGPGDRAPGCQAVLQGGALSSSDKVRCGACVLSKWKQHEQGSE